MLSFNDKHAKTTSEGESVFAERDDAPAAVAAYTGKPLKWHRKVYVSQMMLVHPFLMFYACFPLPPQAVDFNRKY